MLGLVHRMRTPDRLQDGPVGQNPAGVLNEEQEQLELFRRQPNLILPHEHPPPIPIDRDRAERNDPPRRWCRIHASESDPNACQQFFGAEGLGDIIVRAGIERRDLVALGSAGRQDDHRSGSPVAQQPAHLDAVDIRQPQIEHD